jgi:hypothetical protein
LKSIDANEPFVSSGIAFNMKSSLKILSASKNNTYILFAVIRSLYIATPIPRCSPRRSLTIHPSTLHYVDAFRYIPSVFRIIVINYDNLERFLRHCLAMFSQSFIRFAPPSLTGIIIGSINNTIA